MWFIAVCSAILNILFTVLAANSIEPIHTYFYPIAWYTFIIFISAINCLVTQSRRDHFGKTVNSGSTILLEQSSTIPGQTEFTIFNWKNFTKVALISVFVWLVFELFNLRIQNWKYCNISRNFFASCVFGFIAFSTVLPGIFNISTLFDRILKLKPKSLKVTQSLLNTFLLIGSVLLIALLVFPKIFFPLVWICFIFILEPLNYYLFKKPIILNELHKIPSLVIAGFITGILWEFWNFFSGKHWIYTLPSEFLMSLKIFQMPVLGYFGFLPFAIECYQFYRFIENVLSHCKHKLIIALVYVVFCLISFYLVDTILVCHYR